MNQRGIIFIAPIIFLLIGVVIGASLTLGIVQYKDKIAASVSNIFKKTEIVVSNADSVSKDESDEEVELVEGLTQLIAAQQIETSPTPEPQLGADQPQVEAPAPKPKPTLPPAPEPQPEPEPLPSEAPSEAQEGEPTPEPEFEPTPGLDPDLIIQSVTYYPPALVEGDMINFYAAIKNQGEGSANISNANLSIDEVNIKQITTPILISNQVETLIWTEAWKATKGEHKLKICLDADSKISESDEENNCFESTFYVSKTEHLADYIIKSTKMTPSSPNAGDTLSFDAEVYNQGNAFTAGPSSTRLRIDLDNNGTWDILTKDAHTDPMDPNTGQPEHWVNVWIIPQGTHKYEICADALSNINESNENNNCTSKTFTVP